MNRISKDDILELMTQQNSERVVAAIPNYNMGVHCAKLVGQLLWQEYDHVYVLDDASTDNSSEAVSAFEGESRFTFVAGKENIGAGPNRNRIMDYEQQGIVHFLDADMIPERTDNKAVILKAFARHPGAGAIGLRVKNPDDSQYEYNFGPVMNGSGYILDHAWKAHNKNPKSTQARVLKKVFGKSWKNFWTYMHPEDAELEQAVGTVVECNMAVRLEEFIRIGGFAKNMRFHEIHDLSMKLHAIHKSIWYIPDGDAKKYDHGDVRTERAKEMKDSGITFMRNRISGRYWKAKNG